MKIYTHRANGYGHQENSAKAIRAALQDTVDGIELDIRCTKDGQWIFFHDPILDNSSTGKGFLNKLHSSQLTDVRLNDGQRISFVKDLLPDFRRTTKKIILELKSAGHESQVITLIKGIHTISLASFNPKIANKLKKLDPKRKVYFLYLPIPRFLGFIKAHFDYNWHGEKVMININRYAKTSTNYFGGCLYSKLPIKCDGVIIPWQLASRWYIRRMKKCGVQVLCFDTSGRFRAWTSHWGVDGAITDHPHRLRS